MRAAAFAAICILSLGAGRADPLAGRVAGEPAQCIPLEPDTALVIADAGTITYRQNARRLWVTHPLGPCPSLRPVATLVVEVNGGQVCRNDRFRVLQPGLTIASGPCRFDRFVPYDKPAAK